MEHISKDKIITRFAPSPTGFLHIGGVRTALFSYLYSKQQKGKFILRIEDTDKKRQVEGSVEHIIKSLRWLGLDWDYGPEKDNPFGSCLQSNRLDIYKKYAQKLIDKGLAYPDPYSREEVDKFREQDKSKNRPFLFRNYRPTRFSKWEEGIPLRFKVPNIKSWSWFDAVRGNLHAGEEMLDDFILIKADGFPTYNFAHIVDDIEMKVTHVMRGEEFIASTPKFLSLYEALEVKAPVFVTLPPIMGPDGKKKLSKRDNAKDLLDYKKDGYLPEAVINFLALIGWNPGDDQEIFTKEELIEKFSLSKIQKSGGAFNEEKLRWMNKIHLNKKDKTFKLEYFKTSLPNTVTELPQYDENRIERLVITVFERIHNKKDIKEAADAGEYDFAFSIPNYDTNLLKWKNKSLSEAYVHLEKVVKILTETSEEIFMSQEKIKSAVWDYANEAGRGDVLWPMRVALSGKKHSPDPFFIAYVIGKEETILRLKLACDKINSQ